MNYLRQYVRLIRKAEERAWTKQTAPVYVEGHHVFPQSLFGQNRRKVYLTAREHYIAHALLCLATQKRYGRGHWKFIKMSHAFWGMSNQRNSAQKRYKPSALYELSKHYFILSISGENNPMFGKEVSIETRTKITNRLLTNWEDGTRSKEEAAKRLIETRSNQEVEDRRLNNLRLACSGKPRAKETKLKLSQSHLTSPDHTCPHCGKTMKAGNYKRWHGDNCKMKKD